MYRNDSQIVQQKRFNSDFVVAEFQPIELSGRFQYDMHKQKIHFVDGSQQTRLSISSVVETTPEVIAETSSLMEKE
ncbi:MAG: hypothetical protein EZS28_038397 [Streblomastix strix]|uniref:Uncharacterized protein n=1 Tax=Streblomastix strix TaxID=222440 RepID=A0A5J4U663_9EUKA|nr:MAG: hypothetical protein EZS28_038397 [Streblomastix strix]